MTDQKHSTNKTRLSQAVLLALPLLAASGLSAAGARHSSHISSRRSGARNSVVHVENKSTGELSQATRGKRDKRSVFSAFGKAKTAVRSAQIAVDDKALAFLQENGLLDAQAAMAADLSGELIGRKRFASDSPFAHCHSSWGTYYTNTAATDSNKCVNNYGGTWHAPSSKPVVMTTSVANKTATAFDVNVTMSENSTVFAVVLLSSQPAPTSAQVIAGTDGSNVAAVQTKNQAMNPSGTLSFTGLTAGVNYIVYIVGRDGSMEVSSAPKQVNPAYETGMISDTSSWQFPKVRTAANGDFYVARSDSSNIRFLKWNGTGYTLYATLTPSTVPGRSWGGWGNQDSVDYEIDASGHIHVIFAAGTSQWAVDYDPFYAVYDGSSWTYTNIGESGYTIFNADLSLDPNGKVHTTFQGAPAGNALYYASNKSGAWVMTSIATSGGGADELHDSYVLADSSGTAYVFYRREDNQNIANDNYYLATSTDGFVTKTLVLDGKGDGKRYTMANAVMDDDGNVHYAYANESDSQSYYRTNASGSWVQRSITNANHSAVLVHDIQRIGSTYYFANRSGNAYFLESFDGSSWVDGFDFTLTGYFNDRFAISGVSDRVMVLSEDSSDYTIHYHSGTIATYLTPVIANNPPTDISITSTSINQSAGTNATVGTLSTTDADGGDTHTYTLVAGTGDTHNASFNISGSALRANNASALAAGNYSVRLQSSDGAATYAETVTITVVDDVAPTVASVSVPANGTYTAGYNLDFTVHFSDNVTVVTTGGTPQLQLTVGATTRYATYLSGSGTSSLVFRYTVQAGDSDSNGITLAATLQPNSGTLQDAAANNVSTALNSIGNLASVLVDAIAPSGHSVSFTDNAINASEASAISFAFASAEVGAAYSYTISSSGGGTNITGSGTVSSANQQVSSINLNGLGDGTLTLSVLLADTAGNVAGAVTHTASLDNSIPTVAISSGASNPTNAGFNATITFSEAVTGFVVGDISAGNANLSAFSDNSNGVFTVTVTPVADGAVTLNVASNVAQDAAGNNNTAATQFGLVFDGSGPVFSSSSPADNATTVQYDADITLTFNENVNAGAGNISIYDAADNSLHQSIAIGSATVVGSSVTVNPSINFTPTHSYYVQVDTGAVEDALGNDYAGINDNSSLNFTVTNNLPVAVADGATTNEDTAVAISVLANDTDVDSSLNSASLTAVTQPAHGTVSVNTGTGVITYTPSADYNGSDSFTYTVGDVHGGTSAAGTVSVTVTAVNDNPVAVADVVSTNEDQPVEIDVAGNDTDVDTGDSVDTSTITLVTLPTEGTAVITAGKVTYTPGLDYNGSDSFTYRIKDQNNADSNVATVIINVSGVNDAPVAGNDAATTDEDTAVSIDLVANDTDVDGTVDITTVSVIAQPAHGSVLINSVSGVAQYTPAADYFGSDSFTYVVRDNENATSAVATVSITINSVNDAPVATNDTVSLQEDTPHDINVLGNDSDVDGTLNAASVEVVTAPISGTVSVNGAGMIVFTPGDDFFGSDSLTYRVQDNLGVWSNVGTVAITVQSVNDDPLANDDNAQTNEDTAVVIAVLDNDSDVDGSLDTTSIQIESAPANGHVSDNGDGTLTYTPAADSNGTDSFTYSVRDNGTAVSNTATVTVTVQAENDAPLISGTATPQLLEGQAYSFLPTISDVDNVNLTVTSQNLPAWLTLNTSTGEISGTPQVGEAGEYTGIVLSVSDGTASATLAAFAITVIGDNDTDGMADVTDEDDDNDGMSDEYELAQGFNPLNASDAAQDRDGDTLTNLQEFIDNTSSDDAADYRDATAPVIHAPEALVLDAIALFTPVPLYELLGLSEFATSADISSSLAAITTDNVDGNACCTAEVVGQINNRVLLAPGANTVTYRATDRKGNVGTATQVVNVRPLVSVNKDQISVEGATVKFRVILNGKSPFYPLTIPFVIDGASTVTNTDHDLVNGAVVFNEVNGVGQTEAVVNVQLLNDLEFEADETLVVRLDDRTSNAQDLANGYDIQNPDIYDINSGAKIIHRITITEQNAAPDVTLQLRQGGASTIQVTTDGGPVTITATITDPNAGDTHSLDWSASDGSLVDTDSDFADATLVFDPSELVQGRYQATVTVSDDDGATDTAKLFFRVVAALPVLSDQDDTDSDGVDDEAEGTADNDDDGIPDYLDNIVAPNVLPEVASQTSSYLLECDPGVRCRLGQFALLGNTGGARLDPEDFSIQLDLVADQTFRFDSGIFDFEVHDLPTTGQSVRIVLPQSSAIPQQPVYRKLINGSWRTFVEDANNELHSAPGDPGYCPPPGDDEWEAGLIPGYHCVQLTIQDGGPNDGDGLANASVEDPGGVASRSQSDDDVEQTFTKIKSKGKGSSGGSLGGLMLMLLGGLMLRRRQAATQVVRNLAVIGLVAGAFTMAPHPVHAQDINSLSQHLLENSYVSGLLFQAKGSQGASDFARELARDDVAVSLSEYEDTRTAWQIVMGYRYHPHMALEMGYLDLGSVTVNMDATASANDLEDALSHHYPVSGEGWTLSNRFDWNVQERVNLSLEAGIFFWEGQIDLSGVDIQPDIDGGTDFLLGVAAGYRLTDSLDVVAHFKRVFLDDQDVDLLGVEARFHF